MDSGAGGVLRGLRALVLAGVALALAVVAHVSAGGLLPGPWTFAIMVVACALGCSPWFGREASRTEIVALVVGGQTLMHGVMTAVAGHRGDVEPPPATPGGAVAHAAEHLLEELTPAHAPMALAHLAAAVLTGLWLARGERALWNLIRLVAQATGRAVFSLGLPAAPVVPFAEPRPATEPLVVTAPLQHLLLAATHVRRGPPVMSGAV
ncbi:hypothetical protein GCM10028801_19690 [Nocardioides maradonensis]